jgi:hypothetical protein
MSPRPNTGTRAAALSDGRAANPTRVIDDRWNEQMTGVLRRAAEVRESRERARSTEDERAARRETEALLAMIQGHAQPGTSRRGAHPGPPPGAKGTTS